MSHNNHTCVPATICATEYNEYKAEIARLNALVAMLQEGNEALRSELCSLDAEIERKDVLLRDLVVLYRNPLGSESTMFAVAMNAARSEVEG